MTEEFEKNKDSFHLYMDHPRPSKSVDGPKSKNNEFYPFVRSPKNTREEARVEKGVE